MPKNQFNIKYISNFNKVKYFKCKINCFFKKRWWQHCQSSQSGHN